MSLKEKYKYWKITSGNKNGGFIKYVFQSKVFLVFMLFLACIFIGIAAGVFFGILETTEELSADDLEFKSLTSSFYDKDGNEISKVFGYQNRVTVKLSEMSEFLPDAFIAIEDERFRDHNGIDIRRTIGAAINYLLPGGKQYGGSTITQQLIKNITGQKEVSIKRKLQEQVRAIMLEKKLSKDQILELYLNTIFLGKESYGVEAAARKYFDKDSKDLSIAECAMLAGIPQSPSTRNPISDFQGSKERQELVLGKMREQGFMTEEQYQKALKEKIVIKSGKSTKSSRQSYFIDAVCMQVLSDLQNKLKIDSKEAQEMLLGDGLKIYTTMSPKVQNAINEAYSDGSPVFSQFSGGSVKPQSAIVVMDHSNGYILGLCGGYGPKTGIMTFNRAIQAKRQPGSSIKPIAVYGPALDSGLITPATVVDDVPITLGNWSPRNWYKDGFWGLSTIRRAIENSMNIVAVKVWLKVGGDRSTEFLSRLGITISDIDRYSPAGLALGGLTNGVSPLQMTAAYGAIANGGYYAKPTLYTRVEDKNGTILLENKPELTRAMDERAAYVLADMMKGVVGSGGTGSSAKLSKMPCGGKTGTTSNNYDRWFAGFTPYYVSAVWFGYDNDDGKKRSIPGSTNYSAKIWKMVMEKAHNNLPIKDFVMPNGIVTEYICIDSGKLAGGLCSHDPRGNRIKKEIFIEGTQPTETCNVHVKVNICTASGKLATEYCPPENVVSRIKIRRPEPYTPADSDAPLPKDKIHEAPARTCDVH